MTDPQHDVGDRYRSARLRLDALARSFDGPEWDLPVASCPGWRVRDVLAHLVGIIEDAFAGRLTGPPPPDQTAEQVERHRHDDPVRLLAAWSELAPGFEAALSDLGRWPAFFDVLSHEHDVRAAVGDRSFRDHADVALAADLLTASLPPGVRFVVDGRVRGEAADPAAVLTTTSFEVLRLRLGRRSRQQVLAMAWTGDPRPFVDQLAVFGPAATDVEE